ncbi:hypothetical protein [Peribacillus frigoritolerans]|nr:hypothetical protein [Peribacillus frigoritolerans]
MKKFASLLANNQLAKTLLAACVEEAWQTVGGKGADFRNQLKLIKKKL